MFKRLRFKRRPAKSPEWKHRFTGDLPAPKQPLIIVGDIHGSLACLTSLLATMSQGSQQDRWVFVGDYIDRGEQSAEVLITLMEIARTRPDTRFLMGNHEEMMLSFLSEPVACGNRWMRYGGLQTMASFGATQLSESSSDAALITARDHLRSAMPPGMEDWLRALPRYWISGNIGVVHAGANPVKSLQDQKQSTLTWGHSNFGKQARSDGMWIVHGHTIFDFPKMENGVISVDTGAYATGRLSAAHIRDGQVEFIQGTHQ